MNTKPSRRTGLAGVWAHIVAAGIIASSKGRANAARLLLRNARRGIAFFVKNIGVENIASLPGLFDTRYFSGHRLFAQLRAPHLRRSTLDDSLNQRRKAVSVFLGVPNDLADGWRIEVLDTSAQCERHQIFRQRSDKQCGTCQQRILEAVDAAKLSCSRDRAGRVDRLTIDFEVPPLSHRVVIFESKAHGVDSAMAASAHGVATMCHEALAHG